jgi:hypothetical protein
MLTVSEEIYLKAPFGTLTQKAEKALIEPLLYGNQFSDKSIQRRLALYAYANDWEKTDLICELMDLLWAEEKQGDKFPVFREFELFLNNAPDKRGHFVHQFEVYLLGLNILLQCVKNDADAKRFGFTSKDDVYKTWRMTSTSHDSGYPIERASHIVKQLARLYKNLDMLKMSKKYARIIDDISKSNKELMELNLRKTKSKISIDTILINILKDTLLLDQTNAEKLLAKLKENNNHGYVSAIIIFRAVVKSLWSDKQFSEIEKLPDYKILKYSMGAMAVHALRDDQKEFIEKINFSANPYAYLLFIVDNIQDWSRTPGPSKNWPAYNLLNFTTEGNHIRIEYILSHNSWNDKIRENVRKSLIGKKELLDLPKGKPTPSLGYNIQLSFLGNDDSPFDPVNIPI